jgi:hypothetical protein
MTPKIATATRFKAGHGPTGGGHGECTACNHEQVRVINEGLVAGVPLRLLGATYGLSHAALSRHNKHHVAHHTVEQRVQRVMDRLLAKCDEFDERELKRKADDEVLAVIDEFRQEFHAAKSNSRLWSI